MSGGSSANSSWTILTPEETATETLRPLAEEEETENHEESDTSTTKHTDSGPESGPGGGAGSASEGLPVEVPRVPEEITAGLNGASSTDAADPHIFIPASVSDVPPPSSSDVHGNEALSQSQGLPEGPAQSSPDPDSFSDSVTHISPSPEEPPASLLSTETLGGVELTQEETLHSLNGEELHQEGEESELSPEMTDLGKREDSQIFPSDSPVDSEAGEEKTAKTGEEAESEVRRRRSLLAALERIGRREEQEEGEEEFQLPQPEEDVGFSLNKCILGAVILLGIGTIFFSESDYGAKELKESEVPLKQGWLNPEAPPPPGEADRAELFNKLAKGNQQITVLQAQLQAQNEELKAAKGQAAEGAKERLRWEEVAKENSRLKKEMASLPVLQKENERMKRELDSLPALQKELETLRATVTELKHSAAHEAAPAPVSPTASPSSGLGEDSMQGTAGSVERQDELKAPKKKDWKREKYDMGEKKEWKERDIIDRKEGEKKEHKDGGKKEWKEKEWKKEKHQQGKYDKAKDKEGKQKKYSEEREELRERGERKKEKVSRGDEDKPWNDREGKKEWKEKSDGKEWKKEKDWKKGKREEWNEGKQGKGKEKKERKEGKDHGEWRKGKDEWKGEKEWKKRKSGFKESGKEWKEKEKWEKKDWKEKGEKKWKNERKNGKDHDKEWKGKDEKKEWGKNDGNSKNGKDHGKQWKGKEERKEWKREGSREKKYDGDWKKEGGSFHKRKDEHKSHHPHHHDHHEERLWHDPAEQKPPHTHRRPPLDRLEHWVQQKEQLQHNPRPPHQCTSTESCALAEGLTPVSLSEFQDILRGYLAKAGEVGADAHKREELSTLTTEFFKDGVFVHDQMSFRGFVDDVGDILEDMVEMDEDGEDDDVEEEMDGFEREVFKRFSVPEAGEKEERIKGERRRESGRGRG